jgi:hypothetical protein
MKPLLVVVICLILLVGIVTAKDMATQQVSTITTPSEIPTISVTKQPISIAPSFTLKRISNVGVIADTETDISEINSPSLVSISVAKIGVAQPSGKQTMQMGKMVQADVQEEPAKIITAQLFPQAQVLVSDDGTALMQVENSTHLEIHYGYQVDSMHPWSEYFRVDGDWMVYATFADHKIWRKEIEPAKVQAIIDSGTIPAWSELP